jgi:hypothetical protein
MWIITAENLSKKRDRLLSSILEVEEEDDVIWYVKSRGPIGWRLTLDLEDAKIWDNEKSCKDFRDRVEHYKIGVRGSSNTSTYEKLFDKKLKCRKLSIEEWNKMIDIKIQRLEETFLQSKAELLREKK